jgi:uncharacterized protein involved in exopolysaccharide biosynthesis/Mrp family chromosome partitioning ATPase
MAIHKSDPKPAALNPQDIIVAIFKHKWKIVICTILGLLAGAAFYLAYPKNYRSIAQLMVRYVVDRNAIDPEESAEGLGPRRSSDGVIASEAAILKSTDLAVEVANTLSTQTTTPSGRKLTEKITPSVVAQGIDVETTRGSAIISVTYTNPDPEIASMVLNEYVNRYFAMHLEIHRSAAAFDFVQKQADQVRLQLGQTEDELRQIKAKTGVLSLADSLAATQQEIAKILDMLHTAEADLAEQKARVGELEQTSPAPAIAEENPKSTPAPVAASTSATPLDKQKYRAVIARLNKLQTEEIDLLSKYTPENQFVIQVQSQITAVREQRQEMEAKHPDLIATAQVTGSPETGVTDINTERTRMAGLQARIDVLKARLAETQKQFASYSEASPQITQLERQKQLLETNYQNFGATLEKARIEEALDPSKIPNISIVQKPTGAGRVAGLRDKIALGLGASGFLFGIALAVGLELGLNRTLKRPLDLETHLHIPLLASIPYSNSLALENKPKKGPPVPGNGSGAQIAPWEPAHYMHSFCAGLRDRLGLFFQLNNITHKPKLVGVTGFSKGAGTSTIATGLAAALSETGDGKVLLVNMNVNHADVHPFFEGRPTMNLDAAIKPKSDHPEASENLYLATTRTETGTLASQGLKRFHSLLPQFEASDYDYIIFDLPPLGQTSPTVAMAGLMDKVLLVVESEKSDPNAIKRSYAELIAAKANVSAVFNKEKSYLPKWLKGSDA